MRDLEETGLPEGVRRVQHALQAAAHPHAPIMLEGAARTAQEAADSLGVQLGQIAKSVIFKRKADAVAVLVVTSGDRRVDEKKVAALVGKVGRADADFVKAQTGFTIGGVSPVAHLHPPVSLLDQDLWRFEEIWAAAGHPHGVFRLHPEDLRRLTGAPVADVAQANDPLPQEDSVMPRFDKLAALASQVLAKQVPHVPSPCVSVCVMHPKTGLCEGCLRSLPEIGDWGLMNDAAKRQVWQQIQNRMPRASSAPGVGA